MPKAKVLRSQTRKTIYNVYKFMKSEYEQREQEMYTCDTLERSAKCFKRTVKCLKAVQKRTADATGVSKRSVQNIIKKTDENDLSTAFRTPGKKRKGSKRITEINNFEQGVIKRCIHRFHETNKELPTVRGLLTKLRSDIGFSGSTSSLRRIIKNLGFVWKRTDNKRKILIEHHEIRLKRIEYLEQISKYREENRPIVYTDESSIHATHTKCNKEGSDSLNACHKLPLSKEQRVIIVHAGSDKGFVPNCLLMFKSGTKTGDYQNDMNCNNYQKWVTEKLIPNLEPNSVVVMDNASYHNKQLERTPNSNSSKADMVAWLRENYIEFNPSALKPQLYKLITLNKSGSKTFAIDKIFNDHGHTVLRLPPQHYDLNPFELAWAVIKGYVAENNDQKNINKVIDLVKEKVDSIGPQEWYNMCQKVINNEMEYKKSDPAIDALTEELCIRIEEDSGSSDNDNDSTETSDSEIESSSNSDSSEPSPSRDVTDFLKVEFGDPLA